MRSNLQAGSRESRGLASGACCSMQVYGRSVVSY